jgi:hypothetical protein
MVAKQSVLVILGLAVLVGGIIYLSRAVEPPRETVVDVLETEQFRK